MSTRNIYQKINSINKKITTVFKDSEVSMGGNRSYSAVSHDAVTSLLHKPFAEEGIVVVPSITKSEISQTEIKENTQYGEKIKTTYRADVSVSVAFINVDNPSDKFECLGSAYSLDSGDKATGKAYSMAVKQAFLKVFMLESLDQEEARPTEKATYTQKPVHAPQAKPQQQQTQQPQKPVNHAPQTGGVEVSEAQIKRYWGMAKALGWSPEDCSTNIKQQTDGKKSSPKDLTKQEYTIITSKMQVALDSPKTEIF